MILNLSYLITTNPVVVSNQWSKVEGACYQMIPSQIIDLVLSGFVDTLCLTEGRPLPS